MNIGAKVTLRGDRMLYFFDKLMNIALPASATSRGIPQTPSTAAAITPSESGSEIMFPEIEYDKIDKVGGMDVAFVTTAKTDEEAKALLELFGMPLPMRKEEHNGKEKHDQ